MPSATPTSGRVTAPDIDEEVLREPIAHEDPVEEPEPRDPAAPLSKDEGRSALELMLSTEPPPLPREPYKVARLNMTVTLRGLTEKELEDIARRCERRPTKEERERGVIGMQRDNVRFQRLCVVEAMIDPDLAHPQLRERFGPTPEHVLQRWFLAGEIAQMSDFVTDLSGWSDEAVVRAGKF